MNLTIDLINHKTKQKNRICQISIYFPVKRTLEYFEKYTTLDTKK